ncbi:cytochrome P450 [Serendipita vermifera]|nr:cytochrome P450 [Serendipita vermifera]
MGDIISKIAESPTTACTASLASAILGYFAVKGLRSLFSKRIGPHSYPPGPPRNFLIGAMRSFPKGNFFECFNEWATIYGEIVYAPIPGMNIFILNSYESAQELLGKRPGSTAGRRFGYLSTELIGWQWNMIFHQPSPQLFDQRKMLRRAIGPQRVGSHDPLIESVAAQLLTTLTTFHGDPTGPIQDFMGEIVSKATYGDRIWKEMGKELLQWNTRAMSVLGEAGWSFWLVDVFHFLRFTPDWVPGLRFKQLIREGNDLSNKIRYTPYNRGLELYNSGTLGHSILNDLLEEFGPNADVQDVAGILYLAGSDTTMAGAIHFLQALFLFPEVAERVFEEIQAVTQGLRLLAVNDRRNLPFTEAVWKEATRWRPFLPLGTPHVTSQDEVLRGYFIPKGAIIHQNTYMMFNDPKVWGDPEVFRPERFFKTETSQRPNPLTTIFGWGLRICPGMHFADRLAFHMVATIISLYKAEPLEGCNVPNPNDIKYTRTLIQQPVDFTCRFVIRDEKARNLINGISLSV